MVYAIVFYILMGALFAVAFFVVGHRKIDPASAGSKWALRLMWTPAAAALWPLLIYRWKKAAGNSAHNEGL